MLFLWRHLTTKPYGWNSKTIYIFERDIFMDTPTKTNMEPENGPLEKEIPIGNHHLQVPC